MPSQPAACKKSGLRVRVKVCLLLTGGTYNQVLLACRRNYWPNNLGNIWVGGE